MSSEPNASAGDRARASVLVPAPVEEAFRLFTEEIDGWWRRGLRYRVARDRGVLYLEPHVGGRLFETFPTASGDEKIVTTGHVTHWEPPRRLVFQWRAVNFAPSESTEVEVTFEPQTRGGTLVTVTHRGWSRIRPDHPARHGLDVPEFVRMMGRWWGDLLTSLRRYAAGRA